MTLPFSFTGRMPRLPYAIWTFAVFASQHLLAALVLRIQGVPLNLDFAFLVTPLHALTRHQTSDAVLVLALAYLLLAAWMLAVLAYRRAADGNDNEWIAVAAMVPIVQIPVFLYLSLMPPRVVDPASRPAPGGTLGTLDPGLPAAVYGVVIGIGATLLAVAISTLVFGVYGYGIFVVSPFVIGAITAYIANRKEDLGGGRTARLVAGATALGGIALVVVALEGLVCIVLASPLGFGVAWIGGLLGRSIALSRRRPIGQALSGFAILPVVFALENLLPATTQFDTSQSIEINAPPEVVWRAITHMDLTDAPLGLPFRFGVAYPVRGEVVGEGVGAVRRGEFSTGTAIERVTEWEPNRKLAFVVVNDIPAMRELSPYPHVHAPHVIGYFRTSATSFELVPRPNGRTEVVERTSHELRLEPVLYWLPMARWMVGENNARVLASIQRRAERSVGGGG